MLEEKNKLIAYNSLERRIIEPGFCTLCGACEAACPTHAITMENTRARRIVDCSEHLDLCPICYEICPHSEALLLRSLRCVATAPIKNEALGYYRKIVLAQGIDPKLREGSHGGAVVTSLLTYGMENKNFDSAIVSQAEPDNPTKPKPTVASVPDDVLSAVGSKFFPSSVAEAYGSAAYGYGKTKVAFVGVPCHVLALRKMEAWQHKFSGSLKITIGLFCFGTFSFSSMLEHLAEKYKIKPSDIKQMRLSSKFVIETGDDTVEIPIPEIKNHILPSCRTCTDFTAELADISIGGAYPLKDWSAVIIRTKTGEDFFYDAVKNGVINTGVLEQEPSVFEHIMLAAMQKSTSALQEAKGIEEVYGYLPIRLLRETTALAAIKVEEIMTRNIITVGKSVTVQGLLDLIAKRHHVSYPVINEKGEPVGVVTIEDASKVEENKRNDTYVGQIARKVVAAHPQETALDVFKRMRENEIGRILVFDSTDPKKLLGMVTKTDLMHALIKQS